MAVDPDATSVQLNTTALSLNARARRSVTAAGATTGGGGLGPEAMPPLPGAAEAPTASRATPNSHLEGITLLSTQPSRPPAQRNTTGPRCLSPLGFRCSPSRTA